MVAGDDGLFKKTAFREFRCHLGIEVIRDFMRNLELPLDSIYKFYSDSARDNTVWYNQIKIS